MTGVFSKKVGGHMNSVNNKRVRQFHMEDEKVVQEYILGYHDSDATFAYNQNLSDISTLKDPRKKNASQRYHAHQYTNGTTCDLTNHPRETEVFGHMDRYALTVQCPMLCKHPLYHEERTAWHIINCNSLPKKQNENGGEEGKIEDNWIIMVRDTKNPSSGYAFE